MKKTAGIHHITAIVGHPQENVDFYAGVLGMRMIKQTVNFDDPETYHLYFGNADGDPGTVITFFPWAKSRQGSIGDGQVGITVYAVPAGSLSFWEKRLSGYNVPFDKSTRFGETYLDFDDPHGLHLELVEREDGKNNPYSFNGVPSEHAIKGFAGAVLLTGAPEETAAVVEKVMGLERIGQEDDLIRFRSEAALGNTVDIKMTSVGAGVMGVGTVHHIAWRAKDEADHLDWLKHVTALGQHATPVRDRNYFKALYFREKGGILFEIASDSPGFAIDEPLETMGQKLMLPPQYESKREALTAGLIPFEVRNV